MTILSSDDAWVAFGTAQIAEQRRWYPNCRPVQMEGAATRNLSTSPKAMTQIDGEDWYILTDEQVAELEAEAATTEAGR